MLKKYKSKSIWGRIPKFVYGAIFGAVLGTVAVMSLEQGAIVALTGLLLIAGYTFMVTHQRNGSALGRLVGPRSPAMALSVLVIGGFSVIGAHYYNESYASTSQPIITVGIDTYKSGNVGQEYLLASKSNIANGQYTAKVVTKNQGSVHPGNDIIVRSGTSQIVVSNVEGAPYVERVGEGTLTIANGTINVYLKMGQDKVFSGGLNLILTPVAPPPPPPAAPQGKIIKTVQNNTAKTQAYDANTPAAAVNAKPGDLITYSVTVSNVAPAVANQRNDMISTVMTDTLPTGVELVSDPSRRTITENLGTIEPGKSVTKNYQLKVTSTTNGSVLENKACYNGKGVDNTAPQSGCDLAFVKVHVTPPPPPPAAPQGKIIKTVQNNTAKTQAYDANTPAAAVNAKPGDLITYSVTVSNVAPAVANQRNDMISTVMTDTLPTGVELVSDPSRRTITENLGTIEPGKSVTKNYQLKVTSTTNGSVLENKACYNGKGVDNTAPQSGCDLAFVKVIVSSDPLPPPPAPPTPEPTEPVSLPQQLPNVGPGNIIIIGMFSMISGYIFHELFWYAKGGRRNIRPVR